MSTEGELAQRANGDRPGASARTPHHRSWRHLYCRKRPVGADAHIGPAVWNDDVQYTGAKSYQLCMGVRWCGVRDDVGIVPYKHGRTADMVRRAGPMCPAAGMHRKPHNRLVRSDRVGRGLAPAAGTGSPECTGHRPPTARRHTQVPPYIPGRTAGMVRRAGPMCPAAGTHRKPPDRPICSDRVRRGLAPAAGTGSPECTGHRHPHRTAAHAGAALHSRTDCQHGS